MRGLGVALQQQQPQPAKTLINLHQLGTRCPSIDSLLSVDNLCSFGRSGGRSGGRSVGRSVGRSGGRAVASHVVGG
jgi:hypothetical protein